MGRSRKRIKRQNDGEQALGVKMAEQPKAEEELQLESLLFGAKKPLPSQNKGKQRVEQGEHDSDQEEPSVNITDDQVCAPIFSSLLKTNLKCGS